MELVVESQDRIQTLEKDIADLQSDVTRVREEKKDIIKTMEEALDNNSALREQNRSLQAEVEKLKKKLDSMPTVEYTTSAIATAYGTSVKNGGNGTGITATGTRPVEGVTIAADPKRLPYGTKVLIECSTYPEINGVYEVQDTGSAMRKSKSVIKIDIYMPDNKRAEMLKFGRRDIKLSVLSES
jgi:3D (Asp-Asp-Asp) domain-containing protein